MPVFGFNKYGIVSCGKSDLRQTSALKMTQASPKVFANAKQIFPAFFSSGRLSRRVSVVCPTKKGGFEMTIPCGKNGNVSTLDYITSPSLIPSCSSRLWDTRGWLNVFNVTTALSSRWRIRENGLNIPPCAFAEESRITSDGGREETSPIFCARHSHSNPNVAASFRTLY